MEIGNIAGSFELKRKSKIIYRSTLMINPGKSLSLIPPHNGLVEPNICQPERFYFRDGYYRADRSFTITVNYRKHKI